MMKKLLLLIGLVLILGGCTASQKSTRQDDGKSVEERFEEAFEVMVDYEDDAVIIKARHNNGSSVKLVCDEKQAFIYHCKIDQQSFDYDIDHDQLMNQAFTAIEDLISDDGTIADEDEKAVKEYVEEVNTLIPDALKVEGDQLIFLKSAEAIADAYKDVQNRCIQSFNQILEELNCDKETLKKLLLERSDEAFI